MVILGLHFGHDGAVSVVIDGKVVVTLVTERHWRTKHAGSTSTSIIELALRDAGVGITDVNFCAISSTQNFPIILAKDEPIDVTFTPHPDDPLDSLYTNNAKWRNALIWSSEEQSKKISLMSKIGQQQKAALARVQIHGITLRTTGRCRFQIFRGQNVSGER